jgi:nucleoside-diphosphate-sugar epimerase
MDNKPSSAGATLVTGAAGFVGRALVTAMQGRAVRRALRRSAADVFTGDTIVGDISPVTEWGAALAGVDCVVHLAARTHVLHDVATDPLASYRQINVEATRHLAQQAATAGVRRFVFLSSIKVNGEATTDRLYTELDAPAPEDSYGISKREAEDMLRDIAARTGMEVVILRPPLVYGPGVKGNVLRLLQWIDLGLPLPLASVHNSRSMIHVGNLAEAITACIDTPAAANRTFLVADGTDLSTPELIHGLAAGMERTAHLLPCPIGLLQLGASLLGRRGAVARLTGSLRVDSSLLRNTLGWRPRIQPDQGLIDTGRWYHQARIQRWT